MATRTRQEFTAEFKREGVKLAGPAGRSLSAVAREVERSVLKHSTDN